MASKRKTGRRGRREDAGAAASLERAFGEAVRHFRQGHLAEAETALLAIQRRQPDIPDVLHLLALIALKDGRVADAIKQLETAVARAPRSAELYNHLGGALRNAGRIADAVAAYERSVALVPGIAETHYNLANALKEQDRIEDAIACYHQALALNPNFADAHYNLGIVLRRAGRAGEAATALETAIRLNPKDVEALLTLANALMDAGRTEEALAACDRAIGLRPGLAAAHFNRANLLASAGRADEAINGYRQALAIDPAMAEAHNNLGEALQRRGEASTAAGHFRAALKIRPDMTVALGNLGNAQTALGQLDAAVISYRQALEIEPDNAKVLTSLGHALQEMGEFEQAIACHRGAVAAVADFAAAHFNLGEALLQTGRLAEGWREFDWRWRTPELEKEDRTFPQQLWQGEDVAGRTVLVWAEQGVGDEILYAGMVPDLIEAGARVVLECERRLVPLFRRSFAGVRCIARQNPPAADTQTPDIDFQVSAGGLGRWLRSDLGSFPGRPSYLLADEARTAALRKKYQAGGDDCLVGIAWISKNPRVGRQKSMTLAALAPLAARPGVRLVDLQYGDTADERAAFEKETGARILHDEDVDQLADLDTFAAQVAAMDLVISVSNTTVHMAGALGIPVWVMLHVAPLNCWFLNREDSPWYPSARLFRQRRADDWSHVVDRVATALTEFATRPCLPAP